MSCLDTLEVYRERLSIVNTKQNYIKYLVGPVQSRSLKERSLSVSVPQGAISKPGSVCFNPTLREMKQKTFHEE
jgi:hypothetical protein